MVEDIIFFDLIIIYFLSICLFNFCFFILELKIGFILCWHFTWNTKFPTAFLKFFLLLSKSFSWFILCAFKIMSLRVCCHCLKIREFDQLLPLQFEPCQKLVMFLKKNPDLVLFLVDLKWSALTMLWKNVIPNIFFWLEFICAFLCACICMFCIFKIWACI